MDIQVLTADTAAASEFAARRDGMDEDGLERWPRTCAARVVAMINRAGLGHIGGDLSVADILATLYGAVLNVDPDRPDRPGARPLHPSKGHCAGALYATLAALRLLPARGAGDLHGAAVARSTATRTATRSPAWRPTPARSATGSRSRVGCALAAKLHGLAAPHVRRDRRRRAAGGQQLGGGDDRRPLRPRPTSPRSSTATACSRAPAPRTPSSSSRSPTSGRASASRSARSTATTTRQLLEAFAAVAPPASRSP